MNTPLKTREALNAKEKDELLAVDEKLVSDMIDIVVQLNSLAETAGQLMKDYLFKYRELTASARLRPREENDG